MRRFDRLVEAGFKLSLTAGSAEAKGTPSGPLMLRFRLCTHWAMVPSDVDGLVDGIIRVGKTL